MAALRLAGQFGDGMFQAALSGAILFDPARATDPVSIAAGFIVLLLPYSIVGPYAGALLDRWDRRVVLLLANLVRVILIGVTSAGLLLDMGTRPLLVSALATVGVSRFVLAGISAGLPHVARPGLLIPTNSVLTTVGSGVAALGAAVSVGVIRLAGGSAGDSGVTGASTASAVAVSASGSVVAIVVTLGFARRKLGPQADGRPQTALRSPSAALRTVAAGLRVGAAAVWQAPNVTVAMVGIGAHRLVFGIDTLIMVLVLRTPAEPNSVLAGGLVGFGVAIAAVAVGMLLAALSTPLLVPRFGRSPTIVGALAVALVVQLGVVGGLTHSTLLVGALLLGFAGQTIKLTGDAAMQLDIDDNHRGQVFALQDTVFNIAFVLALGLAALVVPADGHSLPLVFVGACGYLVGLVACVLNSRRGIRAGH